MDTDQLCRLFPRLPLFAGVLITAADILIVLIFFRSDNGRQGMLLFEIVIVSLVRRSEFIPRYHFLVFATCKLMRPGRRGLCQLHDPPEAGQTRVERGLLRSCAFRGECVVRSTLTRLPAPRSLISAVCRSHR
jgi:hypothetical protein